MVYILACSEQCLARSKRCINVSQYCLELGRRRVTGAFNHLNKVKCRESQLAQSRVGTGRGGTTALQAAARESWAPGDCLGLGDAAQPAALGTIKSKLWTPMHNEAPCVGHGRQQVTLRPQPGQCHSDAEGRLAEVRGQRSGWGEAPASLLMGRAVSLRVGTAVCCPSLRTGWEKAEV